MRLGGTVRVFGEDLRGRIPRIMDRIAGGIASAHGATHTLDYRPGRRPVVNDERVAAVVEEAAKEVLGEANVENIRPMAGDDFSAYQQVVPGAYFFVGSRNEEKGIVHPHHNARFDVDEDALAIGVRTFLRATFMLIESEEERRAERA